MSVTIMGRVFWTTYPDLTYSEKSGRKVTISETSAKITMLALADPADDFGENSYNSFETLSKKTGLKRRSVIRVVKALIAHRYLSIAGLSVYGTNNFKIAMDKLGEMPQKRATTGRPKSGDSVTKSGDSVTKSGDSVSPESSSIHPESDIDRVASYLLEKKFPFNPNTGTIISGWKEDFPGRDDVLLRAIDEAVMHGAHSLTYVDRILIGWKVNGVPPTREERKAAAKQQKGSGNAQQNRPAGTWQREATDEDYAAAQEVLRRQAERAKEA